mmetsp:Transcript_24355/g.61378  ORF Transcript_24355/g.61378 Transcript_24355/m.61378 type:complete len:454 (-) Transcript_24355:118-1479(-)
MLARSLLLAIGVIAAASPALGVAAPPEPSDLKKAWQDVVSAAPAAEWGKGVLHERRGQICDNFRVLDQDAGPLAADQYPGCAVVFISDPKDEWTVTQLPRNQQNNFQNTQHYHAAWNFDRAGFKADSLPRSNEDISPVCYIANVSGTVTLGYEEGNGNRLLPCPGNSRAYPFTEEEILDPNADLAEMCSMCYTSVCSFRTNPEDCGGGVEITNGAEMIEQATPAYHCHLTMADEGACDYVQYDQHEESREYYMDYSVMCGWEGIREYNLTQCDCTAEAGTANNCQRDHCLNMAATAGVVCGNCGGCSRSRSYDGIFEPPSTNDVYAGQCALAQTAKTAEERAQARLMCSAGLFCRRHHSSGRLESLSSSGCRFHCSDDKFGKTDPMCVPPTPAPEEDDRRSASSAVASGSRKMLSLLGLEEAVVKIGEELSHADIHPDYHPIVANKGTPYPKF